MFIPFFLLFLTVCLPSNILLCAYSQNSINVRLYEHNVFLANDNQTPDTKSFVFAVEPNQDQGVATDYVIAIIKGDDNKAYEYLKVITNSPKKTCLLDLARSRVSEMIMPQNSFISIKALQALNHSTRNEILSPIDLKTLYNKIVFDCCCQGPALPELIKNESEYLFEYINAIYEFAISFQGKGTFESKVSIIEEKIKLSIPRENDRCSYTALIILSLLKRGRKMLDKEALDLLKKIMDSRYNVELMNAYKLNQDVCAYMYYIRFYAPHMFHK